MCPQSLNTGKISPTFDRACDVFSNLNDSISETCTLKMPKIMDIHPVSGNCNNDCDWCIRGSNKPKPLKKVINEDNIIHILRKVLDPNDRSSWPDEFHICGNDSEPLIASETVLKMIKFLQQHGRNVKLITNGLLLNKPGVIPAVAGISQVSVSLDVYNDIDYSIFKKAGRITDGYSRSLRNLRDLNAFKQKYQHPVELRATFVATPRTFNPEAWYRCFVQLEDAGVTKINVREDLREVYGQVPDLKSHIMSMDQKLPGIQIRFASPDEPYSEFPFCKGPAFWPTLAADGKLYPCAHTANSNYMPFADLAGKCSFFEIYQELSVSGLAVNGIGCGRICPPTIGRYNVAKLLDEVRHNIVEVMSL